MHLGNGTPNQGAALGDDLIMGPSLNDRRDMLRADLEAAELPEYDGDGHRLDFHSFRHTAGTWLCEDGVDLKVE